MPLAHKLTLHRRIWTRCRFSLRSTPSPHPGMALCSRGPSSRARPSFQAQLSWKSAAWICWN